MTFRTKPPNHAIAARTNIDRPQIVFRRMPFCGKLGEEDSYGILDGSSLAGAKRAAMSLAGAFVYAAGKFVSLRTYPPNQLVAVFFDYVGRKRRILCRMPLRSYLRMGFRKRPSQIGA